MITLQQLEAQRAEVDKLAQCCQKCQWFGRSVNHNLKPSGQCQLRAPGKFEVIEEKTTTLGGKIFSYTEQPVPSSFPGVWPWDKCGNFEHSTEYVPPTPQPEPPASA